MMRAIPIFSLSVLALPVHAALAPQAGLSGEIAFNVGYTSSTSNFNTDGDKTIRSLDHEASSESGFLLAPLGSVAYTFGSARQQQIYAGTSREDIAVGTLAFELGYKYQLPGGTIVDVSVLPTILSGEVWRNPYATDVARKETDVDGIAYRFKLDNIGGTPLTLDFAYGQKDVDHDDVTDRDLRRDGDLYYAKAQYRLPLSRSVFLMPAATYIHFDADGRANSYDQYGAELSLFQSFGAHNLALTAGYATRDFEHGAATFNGRARDEDELSLFAAYEYQQPFGWQNWSLVALGGYSETSANLDFYDASEYLLSLGVNYAF